MYKIFIFKIFSLCFLVFYLPKITISQSANLGDPPVQNFTKKAYNAGTQVWDIAEDRNGVMWFGNNEGLLEFDGTHWRLYPLSNHTIVRCVQVGEEGKVFVGAQDDFGYFAPTSNGTLTYHSLTTLLPISEQYFGDVWEIKVCNEGVFFRTNHQVFRYHNQQLSVLFPPGKSLHFMGEWMGKLMVQDGERQLFIFENDQLHPLTQPADFRFGTISGILQFAPDTVLVTTINNGIWLFNGTQFVPWKTQDDQFLKTNIIFCSSMLSDGKIALGTSLNGLVVLDRQRRIYHHLNKKSGLQNNTVLSLFTASTGNLWLGLDNGIDFVDINAPFSAIFPDGELQGTGYTAQVFGNKIYFGTNTGLYVTDWKTYYQPSERHHFSKVKNSEGQVWSLQEIDGSLLMGHHEGTFKINGLVAEQLTNLQGIWKLIKISPDYALAGHYNGLAIFKKTDAGWVFESTLNGLTESSRLLAKDVQGNIWMAHPYRGIFKIQVDIKTKTLNVAFFNNIQGLPSSLGNHLFQLAENVVFTGKTGVFRFDYGENNFSPDNNFEHFFTTDNHVRYLKQDNNGNIWYATEHETGMLLVQNNTLEKKIQRIPIPELNHRLTNEFQFVLPVDNQNVFVATEKGFIHFNPSIYHANDVPLRLVLNEVRLKSGGDSILYGGHTTANESPHKIMLNPHQNTIYFSFSATNCPGNELIQYSHCLKDAEEVWSDWNAETSIFLNNLAPGNYSFLLKARNQYGKESNTIIFNFYIQPPWYANNLAYFCYFLLLTAFIFGIVYRQQIKFKKEKEGMETLHQFREEQHQQKFRLSEAVIDRLENEKLEAEVTHKNQELASATLHIVQKSEMLNTIKNGLEKLREKSSLYAELDKEVLLLIKMLEQDTRTDADWEQFSKHFDQVHSDFLKRIGEHHAHLSPNDYKLCAYLRLNLSSKEIATLMNISLRSVESSRYRLRKRLGLDATANLIEYLMRF
jgi:ligand-binding sensor domain-containing protein/DNA-binding CsgD family transcriptional regulator